MKTAAEQNALYREQPFVIAQKMNQIEAAWNGEETVLVQGIIDAYFIEDDEIVLVDYKTDKVSPGGEQDLIDLYHIQLEDYAAALERMLQKKVKETYIYSFTLRKMIPLSWKYPVGQRGYTLHPAGYLFLRVWPTSLPNPIG